MSLWDVISGAVSTAAPIVGSVFGPAGTAIGAGIAGGLAGINKAHDVAQVNDAVAASNAYNSPSAQMDRLKAAGISPWVAQGMVGNGNQSSLPNYAPAVSAYSQQVSTIPQNASNSYNVFKQGEKADSEIVLNKANASKVPSEIALNQANLAKVNAETDLTKLNSDAQDLKNYLLAKYGDMQSTADLEKIASEIANNEETRKLTKADVNKVASDILLNYAQIKNLNVNSANVQAMFPFLVAKLKAETGSIVATTSNTQADTNLKLFEGQYQQGENNWQNTKNAASLVTGIVTDIVGAAYGAGAIKGLFKGGAKAVKGFGR